MSRKGNSTSVFSTLGASNHSLTDRQNEDYYATDPIAIDRLIEDGGVTFSKDIWECCCGEGHISKRLQDYGYNVISTDLVDRGYGTGGVDFLKCNEKVDMDIVTNPPYSLASEFIYHAMDVVSDGNKVFMFLRILFLV